MYKGIKSDKKIFKITDLIGVLVLIHPIYVLLFKYPPNILFYIQIIVALFFLTRNLFGITGYIVRLDKESVVFYNSFFPHYVKIKDIVEIEKDNSKLTLTTTDGKLYYLFYENVTKSDRCKINDLFYHIHNRVYSKTLKL